MTFILKSKHLLTFTLLVYGLVSYSQNWIIEDTSNQSGTAALVSIEIDGVTQTNGLTYGIFYMSGDAEKCIGYETWSDDIQARIILIYLPNDPAYNHNNRYFKIYSDIDNCELDIISISDFNPNSANIADPSTRLVFGNVASCQNIAVTYQTEDYCAGATVLMKSDVPPLIPINFSSATLDVSTDGAINLGSATSGKHTISTSSSFCLRAPSIEVNIPTSIQSVEASTIINEIIPQRCNELGQLTLDWSSVSPQPANPIYNEKSVENLKTGIYKFTAKTDQNCFYTSDITIPLEPCEELSFYPSMDSGFYVDATGETSVFNSAGKLLLKTQAPFNWGGNDNTGAAVPTGQYFIVPIDSEPIPVTIIR